MAASSGTRSQLSGKGPRIITQPEAIPFATKPCEIDAVSLGKTVNLQVQITKIVGNPTCKSTLAGARGAKEE